VLPCAYDRSLSVLGMADEFKGKVAVNALWPRYESRSPQHSPRLPRLDCVLVCATGSTGIATAAIKMIAGSTGMRACRSPEIMADAAHWILTQRVGTSGNFFIDDEVLRGAGATDKDIDKWVSSPRGWSRSWSALPLRCVHHLRCTTVFVCACVDVYCLSVCPLSLSLSLSPCVCCVRGCDVHPGTRSHLECP
jgi:hypothetical protein